MQWIFLVRACVNFCGSVRVQRIVAGFPRNIDNVCGHWAIIEKGFKSFLLFTQLNSEAMYCECIFRCRWQIGFSSLLHFVVNFLAWKIALQQTALQLIQMSMLALLVFTKTTFYFCPIGPKVGFWLASHCTYYTKAKPTLHYILCSFSVWQHLERQGK